MPGMVDTGVLAGGLVTTLLDHVGGRAVWVALDRFEPIATRDLRVDYMRAAHVVPMPYSISQRGVIDSVLASMRINRDERVAVQSFTAAPYLLQGTDLVFTTTRHFAQFYAQLLPLAIIPSPIAFPPMRFYQLWHERNHHSAGHRWLRQRVFRSSS